MYTVIHRNYQTKIKIMSRIINLIENFAEDQLKTKLITLMDAYHENSNILEKGVVLDIFNITDIDELKSFRSHERIYPNITFRMILTNIISILYDV